jgi:hypothetical protein
MESNPLPSFCQHVNHNTSTFKYITSTVIQVIITETAQLSSPKLSAISQVKLIFLSRLKVKESRNRPGVAQRVPGGLGSQNFMTFGT